MARQTQREARRGVREERYTTAMKAARTGKDRAQVGWDWVRREMELLADLDPDRADQAWRDLADSLVQIARDAADQADEAAKARRSW